VKHFLDTFALVEILNGNAAYAGEVSGGGTSLYHLYELHVQVARLRDEATADAVFRDLRRIAEDVRDGDVLAASRVKRAHAKKKLSYGDALGYAMAGERGIAFVTGDRAFRGMDGVRFIAGA
jgi:predicted nucleic acid-binding protein